jgi:hypothetical protein
MYRTAAAAIFCAIVLVPAASYAALNTVPSLTQAVLGGGFQKVNTNAQTQATQQEAQAPAACEQSCSQSAAGNCKKGDVTGNPNGDVQCAASHIGVPEYTKLSSFGSSGSCVDKEDNNVCASGSCTTWRGERVFGVAHRTFPFGTRMEVCNIKNGVCQIATVIERGPHAAVGSVTVDARVELADALLMGCNGTTQATYRVLSVPGVSQTAQPSGPAQVGLDALLAAGHVNGDLGNNSGNPAGYTAVNTPYGQGYLGTPTSKPYYAMQPSGSPYASASPAPIQTSASQTGAPISQQLGSSPYSALTSSNAAANTLQQALQPTTPKNPSQVIVPGAPSIGFIYAQQHVVSRSSSVMLSWTTLNMKQGSCAVSLNNQKVATGEEGTKSIAASSLPTGSLVFILTCTAADGTPFSKSETVTVQ